MAGSLSEFYQDKEEKIFHRYEEILKCLIGFQYLYRELNELNIQFRDDQTAEDMALSINTAYWLRFEKTFNKFVRSKVGEVSNVEHYKIASGIELAIIDLQPFIADNDESTIRLNAEFAMFTSLSILRGWNGISYEQFSNTVACDIELQKFLDDHKVWLINLGINFEYPVYLNAQVWALFMKAIKNNIEN